MNRLKTILLAGAAICTLGAAAQAADLPTKKAPPAPAPAAADCHASFSSWLDSTAAACPLTYMGVTVYGALDIGVGYNTHAAPAAPTNGNSAEISKFNGGPGWQWMPNGLGTSVVGVKMKEDVTKDWSLVADISAQFDPQSLEFLNGPESAYQQNYVGLAQQQASGDNSKAYGIASDKALVGVSNPVLGTLTVGRQRTFSYDLAGTYDATGANNFSLIGMTATPVGALGLTTLGRYNTSVKYFDTYGAFHGGVMYQFGGFEQGNTSNGAFEADIGASANGFSFDAMYQHAKDAASLSAFGSSAGPGAGVPGDTLKLTLANLDGGLLMAKYNWQQFTVYGGYAYDRRSAPSDLYGVNANGASGGGWFINGLNGGFPGIMQANAYVNPDVLQTLWTGVRYSALSNLDLDLSYSHEWQND